MLSLSSRYDLALVDFLSVEKIDAAFWTSLCGASEVYSAQGKFEEAAEYADKAVAVAEGEAQAHKDRGFAMLKLQRLEESATSYERARELGDDKQDTAQLLSIACTMHAVKLDSESRSEEALTWVDKAVAAFPSFDTTIKRALILSRLKRFDEVDADLGKALAERSGEESADENADGWALVGIARVQSKDWKGAAEALEKVRLYALIVVGFAPLSLSLSLSPSLSLFPPFLSPTSLSLRPHPPTNQPKPKPTPHSGLRAHRLRARVAWNERPLQPRRGQTQRGREGESLGRFQESARDRSQ